MKGNRIGNFEIGFDFSGNETKGYVVNTLSGENNIANVVDIDFQKTTQEEAQIKWETKQLEDLKNEARLVYLIQNAYELLTPEQKNEYDNI